jgi:hypothetical protein
MDVKLEDPAGQGVDLRGELRLRLGLVSSDNAKVDSVNLRVSSSDAWNPRQPIYFETCAKSGDWELVKTGPSTSELRVVGLAGWYRAPVFTEADLVREHDFLLPHSYPVQASLSLTLQRIEDSPDMLAVSGLIDITSPDELGALVLGTFRGLMHAYSGRLPSLDKSRQVVGLLRLPVQIFLVKGSAAEIIVSRNVQIATAIDFWGQCGILVDVQGDDVNVVIDRDDLAAIIKGRDLAEIRRIVRDRPEAGRGVPIIFIPSGVPGGGGETVGHGAVNAMVVLNDQNCKNDTLLAHELGHVLGGKEANDCRSSDGFWCDAEKTIMDGGETLCKMAPPKLGDATCQNARCFASYWRQSARSLVFLLAKAFAIPEDQFL